MMFQNIYVKDNKNNKSYAAMFTITQYTHTYIHDKVACLIFYIFIYYIYYSSSSSQNIFFMCNSNGIWCLTAKVINISNYYSNTRNTTPSTEREKSLEKQNAGTLFVCVCVSYIESTYLLKHLIQVHLYNRRGNPFRKYYLGLIY